jgi:hypothetical protein
MMRSEPLLGCMQIPALTGKMITVLDMMGKVIFKYDFLASKDIIDSQ